MELRKVQVQEARKAPESNGFGDVASILARRIAVEYSSSEDESETGSEWSDGEDEWMFRADFLLSGHRKFQSLWLCIDLLSLLPYKLGQKYFHGFSMAFLKAYT